MTISLRLNDADSVLIKKYAELNHVSVSELVRRSVLEKIEDEYDLDSYHKAIAEYNDDPISFSLDEVKKELGFK